MVGGVLKCSVTVKNYIPPPSNVWNFFATHPQTISSSVVFIYLFLFYFFLWHLFQTILSF